MKFKIPKGWSDVTIGQFQEINRLDKSDELDYLINLVSVLCNLEVDLVESLTLSQLQEIGQKMSFISTMPDKFINDFKLNGNHYIIDCNIAHISAGQYIDLQKYIEKGTEENLHNILTVFCFPSKRVWFKRKPLKYGKGYSINALADEFKQVPFSVAYPLAVFFCKLLEKSIPVIKLYLEKELVKLEKKQKKLASKNIGAGLQ